MIKLENQNDIKLKSAKSNAISLLMKHFKDDHFEGELSSSALSCALATFTFGLFDRIKFNIEINKGLNWLIKNQNKDGGWGDTTISHSNISTTLICWATLIYFNKETKQLSLTVNNAESWLRNMIGRINQNNIMKSIRLIYGKDKTFSVPILTMLALAIDGEYSIDWSLIPQLPFELAIFPHKLYKWLKFNVVSYAIPALIAIGVIRHKKKPTKNIPIKIIRDLIGEKAIKRLEMMQPETGGFLEAIPLTSFVLMSLCGMGIKNNRVIDKGLDFLKKSIRKDGGYPIDTDLNTWITTLSVNAFKSSDRIDEVLDESIKRKLINWILKQQNNDIHPFTNASPGGWGWTDLRGAVPDGDDSSGALISLFLLDKKNPFVIDKAKMGIKWLLSIQNNDGGIPAFCRGWGKLPFDASCPDITAHFIRALLKWKDFFDLNIQKKMKNGIKKGIRFLRKSQNKDGSWIPLWFGNENSINKENPVFGTSQVLITLRELNGIYGINSLISKACEWLIKNQNKDGGWGGKKGIPSSIEETALAINALTALKDKYNTRIMNGLNWILKNTDYCTKIKPAPIGLYFASLWYYEKLYPVIFIVSALERIA